MFQQQTFIKFKFDIYRSFVEVWIIRINRRFLRPRRPWEYSVDDYRFRRRGLILVRRIFQLHILREPFTCGADPLAGRRRRRRAIDDGSGINTDEDSEEGGRTFIFDTLSIQECAHNFIVSAKRYGRCIDVETTLCAHRL